MFPRRMLRRAQPRTADVCGGHHQRFYGLDAPDVLWGVRHPQAVVTNSEAGHTACGLEGSIDRLRQQRHRGLRKGTNSPMQACIVSWVVCSNLQHCAASVPVSRFSRASHHLAALDAPALPHWAGCVACIDCVPVDGWSVVDRCGGRKTSMRTRRKTSMRTGRQI